MNEGILALVSAYGPLVAMVIAFYFFLYRPQRAEQRRRDDMLATLHKGNKVVTVGGIFGEIMEIKNNVIELKIADKVIVKVTRSAVSRNITQGKSPQMEPEKDYPDEAKKQDE
ncbi:MAG: preprotein translocase subunit YajC [Lachnospiraceae bacterium]|nr:preprotein translocase subunit YajC [Lachnospiraceae bacterium]